MKVSLIDSDDKADENTSTSCRSDLQLLRKLETIAHISHNNTARSTLNLELATPGLA